MIAQRGTPIKKNYLGPKFDDIVSNFRIFFIKAVLNVEMNFCANFHSKRIGVYFSRSNFWFQ